MRSSIIVPSCVCLKSNHQNGWCPFSWVKGNTQHGDTVEPRPNRGAGSEIGGARSFSLGKVATFLRRIILSINILKKRKFLLQPIKQERSFLSQHSSTSICRQRIVRTAACGFNHPNKSHHHKKSHKTDRTALAQRLLRLASLAREKSGVRGESCLGR